MTIDLNADAGEAFGVWHLGNDTALFDYVSSANIACGFHAGDPLTIQATIDLAKQKGICIGAHPSYLDLVGFGRRAINTTSAEVYADVLYQISAVAGFANVAGLELSHVKAHGALSNVASQDAATAKAIAQAVYDFDKDLPLVVLPSTQLETQALALNLPVIKEGFPERAYLQNGQLAPRSMQGSSIHDPQEAARRAVQMVTEKRIATLEGGYFSMDVQTLCIHGDNPNAVEIAKAIREKLEAQGIMIKAIG
jgi:5-oxoprolinase (ATP-hydrolysing) subunit A